jgi:hypothetical protein
MTDLDSTLMRPATKAAVMLFTGTALVLACFAPAIANQKEQSRYGTHNSHRPIIVGYLA